jgi:hypothetical protein
MGRAKWVAVIVLVCAAALAAAALAAELGRDPADVVAVTPDCRVVEVEHSSIVANSVPAQSVVRAQRFELVDQAGRVKAVLGFDAQGNPHLRMWDTQGREIYAAPDKPRVRMLGK